MAASSKKRRMENQQTGVCNWCAQLKSLTTGKKFCVECGKQGRECTKCHRPMPNKYFNMHQSKCDACTRKNDLGRNKESSLSKNAQVVTFIPNNHFDLLEAFKEVESLLLKELHKRYSKSKGIKWFLSVQTKLSKTNSNDEEVVSEPIFRTTNVTSTNTNDFEEQLANGFLQMYKAFENFQQNGSGWVLDRIQNLKLHVASYQPLKGSSYLPLPKKIRDKVAVLNIENHDEKCFLWSILAHLHPREKHSGRVKYYQQFEHELKTTGIEFPVPLHHVAKFEYLNNMSVNVFGWDDGIFPLHISQNYESSTHINLLYITNGPVKHYCLIKNFSRLMGDSTKHGHKSFYCFYCLHRFSSQRVLETHKPLCMVHAPQKIRLPEREDEKWVYFKNFANQLKVPFVIYADFECYTKPIAGCSDNPNKSSTRKYQHHVPSGYSYIVVGAQENLIQKPVVYRGTNVVEHFLDSLIQEEQKIGEFLQRSSPLLITEEQEREFQNASDCHICGEPLGLDRVRDHNHIDFGDGSEKASNYRGAAHSICNLNFKFKSGSYNQKDSYFIPIIMHNSKQYDTHLIMQALGKYKDKNINCIPNNMEKYISFSCGSLRFIDSFQFLGASLENLVGNLEKNKFNILKGTIQKDHKSKLLLRKGVYPYDYIDSESKLLETTLPPKEAFYSVLTGESISKEDYSHAKSVWNAFKCKSLGDYHDIYLKSDVLLLADVFENFRNVCLKSYSLDPAHYFTAPGLAWDAMLKLTKAKLQLIDDIDMYLMIESGLRGGVSMVSNKYAKANNPYMSEYDPTKSHNYITYLDANNLYGWAMSKNLPECDFCWMTETQLKSVDISSIPSESDTGYIFDVDLEYCQSLHDLHSDYPLAPEKNEN